MSTSSAIDLESGGEAQLADGHSSSSLKLFTYSGQAEFQDDSSLSSLAYKVLANIDIAIHIANHLHPDQDNDEISLYPYKSLNAFSRICTATYPSGVAVLYRNVLNVSILWSILIDEKKLFGFGRLGNHVIPSSLSYLIDAIYGRFNRDLAGEDPQSYKLRRFVFICSRVQILWATRRSFTIALSAFFMDRIPSDSQYLFPALKSIFWIEKDSSQSYISLRTSPIELPVFKAFRPTALRFLSFELHDWSMPLTSVLSDVRAVYRISEFIALLRRSFPNFYVANLCICHPDFCAHPYTRMILNKLNTAVLKTKATVIFQHIPEPFLILPGVPTSYPIKENVTIDVITAKGRTFIVDPHARHYHYPAEETYIFSALTMTSPLSLVLSYHTNMSFAEVRETTMIIDILKPYFLEGGLQYATIHLESIAIPLLPRDILRIGAYWRQLHFLDLRFQVIREKIADMPTVETLRTLTSFCPVLEYLILPDLNVQGFKANSPHVSSFSLGTLTSTSLLSCNEEATEVASALLVMFPGLTDVMVDGISASGWKSIGKAIQDHPHDSTHELYDDTALRLMAALIAPPIADEDLFY